MNNIEIEQARKKYNDLHEEIELVQWAKKKLIQLENDPIVKEYLELKEILNKHIDKSVLQMASESFKDIATSTNDSKKIYIFMGFFDKDEEYTNIKDDIQYALFMDLETLEGKKVSYNDYYTFKANNKVIYKDDEFKLNDINFYYNALYNTREQYLYNLIDLDQEEAIERLAR